MNFKDLVVEIINLPYKFYSLGNVSIYSLLKDTGYFPIHDQIRVEDFIEELNNYPSTIDDWLNWSENKRVDSGWYFKQSDLGPYVVGYFSKEKVVGETTYSDKKQACAAFIKNEIEDIRKD